MRFRLAEVHAYGANPDDDDVFVYTTGSIVPNDIVRARVHPSVTIIPREAFMNCNKLEEVELCKGCKKSERRHSVSAQD